MVAVGGQQFPNMLQLYSICLVARAETENQKSEIAHAIAVHEQNYKPE